MNAKVLQTFMGDASITVTLDICAHLMPGGEAEAAALTGAPAGATEPATS